ncbi:MAG: HAD family hydrolase [Candidatus Woesearchaeota archaeon]
MVSVISFDMDATLVSEDVDNVLWDEEIPRLYAQKNSVSLRQAKLEVYAEYYKKRYIDKIPFWTDLSWWMKFFGLPLEAIDVSILASAHLYPEVIDVLTELSRSYTLVVVTNAHPSFMNIKLQATRIHSFFSHIYTSVDSVSGKKDASLWKKLLLDLGVSSSEVLHVGDNLHFDKEVPESVGVSALYLDRFGGGDISSLSEIKRFL